MAIKTICSIPLDWTIETYRAHTCFDGSHSHISHAQLAEHKEKDLVDVLVCAQNRRERTIVKIEILPVRNDSWAGKPSRSRASGSAMNGGLSYRVGEYLAKNVRKKQAWALVMLSQINNRPEREIVTAA